MINDKTEYIRDLRARKKIKIYRYYYFEEETNK